MDDSIKALSIQEYPDGRLDTWNAAKYTGYAVKTLAMMRSKGSGPTYIKRGKVFYFRDDLDAWLRAGKTTSTAQSSKTKETT